MQATGCSARDDSLAEPLSGIQPLLVGRIDDPLLILRISYFSFHTLRTSARLCRYHRFASTAPRPDMSGPRALPRGTPSYARALPRTSTQHDAGSIAPPRRLPHRHSTTQHEAEDPRCAADPTPATQRLWPPLRTSRSRRSGQDDAGASSFSTCCFRTGLTSAAAVKSASPAGESALAAHMNEIGEGLRSSRSLVKISPFPAECIRRDHA